jgi:endonuclease/exonuclease/phosphatase family metal-dependent hydrolase/PKD repeat protein
MRSLLLCLVPFYLCAQLELFAGTPPTPTITPNGGTFTAPIQVSLYVPPLAGDTVGYELRYTTDGSTPVASSPLFNPPVAISSSRTIKVKAFKYGVASAEASAAFTISNPGGTQLRVMDFNIQLGGLGTDNRTDLPRIARYMANADIISINEISGSMPTIKTELERLTGVTWYSRVFSTGGGVGNAVLSRFPFTAAYNAAPTPYKTFSTSWYDSNAGVTRYKAIGHAQFSVNGNVLNFFCTRIETGSQTVRQKQLIEMKAYADGFAEPRIIAGDFNAGPSSPEVGWMVAPPASGQVTLADGTTATVSTRAWTDSWAHSQSLGTASGFVGNSSGNTRTSRIDYIFVSSGATALSVKSMQVPDPRATPLLNPNSQVKNLFNNSFDYGVRPSDHMPLIAIVQLSGTSTPVNQPPVANAGADRTITLPSSTALSGTATDDGLPNPPAATTKSWTKVSGPGTVTFSSPSSLSTNASFSTAGTYVLRLSVSDSALSDTDDVTVTVNPAPAILPSPWLKTDIGGVSVAGNTTHSAGTFTVSASGTDLYDSADAFHLVYQQMTGDCEIVARVAAINNPGSTFALAAVTFRQALTPNSVHASMMVTDGGKAKFRRRETVGATTLSDGPAGDGTNPIPRWLKLTRIGNTFKAGTSADGVDWQQIHSTETIVMPATVYVGFLALRNDNAGLCSATISNVAVSVPNSAPVITSPATANPNPAVAGQNVAFSGGATDANGDTLTYSWNFGDSTTAAGGSTAHTYAAAGTYSVTLSVTDGRGGSATSTLTLNVSAAAVSWTSTDVGAVGLAGTTSISGGTFTINAAGTDIYGTADAFRFVHRQLTGDGAIIARVTSIQNTHEWAQAGVMMRESLDANSPHATMMVTRVDRAKFRRRKTMGSITSSNGPGPGSGQILPQWIKLERQGSTFRGYRSDDGVNWILIGTDTVSLSATVYVGIYGLSCNTAARGTSILDNVSISGVSRMLSTASRVAAVVEDIGVFSISDNEKVLLSLPGLDDLQGKRGIKWSALKSALLPKGLRLKAGTLNGKALTIGTHAFTVRAGPKGGESEKTYRLTITQ